jgi:hypothetical protein
MHAWAQEVVFGVEQEVDRQTIISNKQQVCFVEMVLRAVSLMASLGMGVVFGEKIGDMEQGAEFTKCIKLEDFHTKTLDDDVTLVDRDADTGCCPADSTAGPKQVSSYQSAQIVCGFKDDGSLGSVTTGSTCNYGKCFVHKQSIECTEGKQLLNGCCGAKDSHTFKDECKYYDRSSSSNSVKTEWCTTYHKDYGTIGWKGTSDTADDIKEGKFQPDKFYTYATCEGGGGTTSGGSSTSSAVKLATGMCSALACLLSKLL